MALDAVQGTVQLLGSARSGMGFKLDSKPGSAASQPRDPQQSPVSTPASPGLKLDEISGGHAHPNGVITYYCCFGANKEKTSLSGSICGDEVSKYESELDKSWMGFLEEQGQAL